MLDRLVRIAGLAAMLASAPLAAAKAETQAGGTTAFDFSVPAIDGSVMRLDQWRGKVLLVVNTASFCGYTGQYQGLQKLWSDYEAKGLVVLGVPSNDFMQEPKGEDEIKSFCEGAFGVTFPLSAKLSVTGTKAHPFFRWLAASAGAPKWNFYKYLVGRDGKVIAIMTSRQTPTSPEVTAQIEKALASSPAPGSR